MKAYQLFDGKAVVQAVQWTRPLSKSLAAVQKLFPEAAIVWREDLPYLSLVREDRKTTPVEPGDYVAKCIAGSKNLSIGLWFATKPEYFERLYAEMKKGL